MMGPRFRPVSWNPDGVEAFLIDVERETDQSWLYSDLRRETENKDWGCPG